METGRLCSWLLCLSFCLASACQQEQRVVIFHAASLGGILDEVRDHFAQKQPAVLLQLESSGSVLALRKLVDLGRWADLVMVADWRLLDRMLIPNHALWSLRFATNEVVLAYAEHSLYTDKLSADNWTQLLTRPEVRLGRANENTAPIGFQTLLVWRLTELVLDAHKTRGWLTNKLLARCRKEHVVPDVKQLVSLLESRSIDYAFVFRSIAEEHRLKTVRLDDRTNLSRVEWAAFYQKATIQIKPFAHKASQTLAGSPIVYGLGIPVCAKKPHYAQQVVSFLLGPSGKRIMQKYGLRPLSPAESDSPQLLPSGLRGFVDSE